MNIGIVGAGFIGQAIARRALAAGYRVMLSNSRGPGTLVSVASELGCEAGEIGEAAAFGDRVVVAIPFNALPSLDSALFGGKVVIDTCNHYPGRDGPDNALDTMRETTGERMQRHLFSARVVKAFNAIMQADIGAHARPSGAPDRRALPIAGDAILARQQVVSFVNDIGFDVVDAGAMHECWRFERAMPAYCVPMSRRALAAALAGAERGRRLPEGSWKAPRPLQQ